MYFIDVRSCYKLQILFNDLFRFSEYFKITLKIENRNKNNCHIYVSNCQSNFNHMSNVLSFVAFYESSQVLEQQHLQHLQHLNLAFSSDLTLRY
jgi:hypothetical protein